MISSNKILYAVFLVVGLFIIYFFHTKITDNEKAIRNQQLTDTHKRVVERFDASIERFAALMSGIHSKFSEDKIPTQIELQSFLKRQLNDIKFNDSIVISYLSIDHEFIYNFDAQSINKYNLIGKKVGELRDSLEINRLNNLIKSEEMKLFPPINLIEGWIGIPLNFKVTNQNETIGYIASLINFKNLIDPIYEVESSNKFAFMFSVENGSAFDREMVHDGSKVYHERSDREYYGDYKIDNNEFTLSKITKYGLTFNIGTAYKNQYTTDSSLSLMFACWSILIIFFWGLSLRSNRRVSKLNDELVSKNDYIEIQRKELEIRNTSLNDYAQIVTHDLKAPLRNLNTLFFWLKDESEIKSENKDLLNKMEANLETMDKLIEDVYKYSQLDYQSENKKAINFQKIVDNLTDYFESSDKLEIITNLKSIDFQGDETKIKQLFQNLIDNAIRYNDKEKCIIYIECEKQNEEFLFKVKDNGIGIEERYHSKVFKVFQKLSNRYDSTGVGLAIVKKIVTHYKGKIWIESEIGKSTTFLFTLSSK